MAKANIPTTPLWFSHFYGIDLPQYELPFVDFSLTSDVPLYIDPYAITKDSSDLATHCHNSIVSFFQALLDAIRNDNRYRIKRLISKHLSEPNQIHLGVAKVARKGRGIGEEQEDQVIKALASSSAIRTGAIQAIQEIELHIEGIGPDKISDLVANIILDQLSLFTQDICAQFGISTRPCAVSGYWNQDTREWDGGYFNLPVNGIDSYILVPKKFVRREQELMNHRGFYEKYVLDVLKRETLNANDSLVQTLKNGTRRVTKKSLREDSRFALSKQFISQFIIEHPDEIDAYRNQLSTDFNPVDPAFFSGKSELDDPKVENLLQNLRKLPTGRKNATTYHMTVLELLEFVFDWGLENFEYEQYMDQGRGRIDIIADNYASGGLFAELRAELSATSIPIECKNYSTDLGNKEFDQIADRLSPTTSRFGMLFCRNIEDAASQLKHCTDRWLRQKKVILLFDDTGLTEFVQLRLARNYREIEARLRKHIRFVKYGGNSRAN